MQTSLGHTPTGPWVFDDAVTVVFEDMLKRSIPQYDVMRLATVGIVERFAVEEFPVIDLGCSRGDLINLLIERGIAKSKLIGLDASEPMINAAMERFNGIPGESVSLMLTDVRNGLNLDVLASVVVSSLTIQFTPIEYRQNIIKSIYDSLIPGGCFIFIEKVLGSSAEINNLMVDLYYELKSKNGYSDLEIERKRLSLEGVLVPVTGRWNEDLLAIAGFRYIDCFWRWMNFAGWIAIK